MCSSQILSNSSQMDEQWRNACSGVHPNRTCYVPGDFIRRMQQSNRKSFSYSIHLRNIFSLRFSKNERWNLIAYLPIPMSTHLFENFIWQHPPLIELNSAGSGDAGFMKSITFIFFCLAYFLSYLPRVKITSCHAYCLCCLLLVKFTACRIYHLPCLCRHHLRPR